jgi:hypothetical protein
LPFFPNPFSTVRDLTVKVVDAVAGAGKTNALLDHAVSTVRPKFIIAMPTHALITQAERDIKRRDPNTPVTVIHSRTTQTNVVAEIAQHIHNYGGASDILFITHEGFNRVTDWPLAAAEYDLFADEMVDVVLTHRPYKLRYTPWVVTNFLDVEDMPLTPAEREARRAALQSTKYDFGLIEKMGLAPQFEDFVSDDLKKIATTYGRVIPKSDDPYNPWKEVDRRLKGAKDDEVYETVAVIGEWLKQGVPLFTDMAAWKRLTREDRLPDRRSGTISFIGFRRPDAFGHFKSVTIMSALFTHSLSYAVWEKLGVKFVPSDEIIVNQTATPLGKRKLQIYYLYDQEWSKRARDNTPGGIGAALKLIADTGVIDQERPVCVVLNNDDKARYPNLLTDIFPHPIDMPGNSRGMNAYRFHQQMIHAAALNAYTSDMNWLADVYGINRQAQRIARVAVEVYQAAMRLDIRNPNGTEDITLVVMDKDVAEWLKNKRLFEPDNQVEVIPIDTQGVLRRKDPPGPKPTGDAKEKNRVRQAKWRKRQRDKKQQTPPKKPRPKL